jgi:hypothetical protein
MGEALSYFYDLDQGSQTRDPPGAFVRPAFLLKTYFMLNLHQIYLNFKAFHWFYGPRNLFSLNCGPLIIFHLECGPQISMNLRPLI